MVVQGVDRLLSQACVECCPVGSDGCPIQCQLPMRCRSADTFRRQVWVIGCPIRCRFADTAHIFGAQHNFWCTARYKKKQWGIFLSPHGLHPPHQSLSLSNHHPISPTLFLFHFGSKHICSCCVSVLPKCVPQWPTSPPCRSTEIRSGRRRCCRLWSFAAPWSQTMGGSPPPLRHTWKTYVT